MIFAVENSIELYYILGKFGIFRVKMMVENSVNLHYVRSNKDLNM